MDAPAIDDIDVVVFRPGFGESVLIHLGNNDWAIIDSCIDSKSGRPAALLYLERIGVNTESAVKFVFASHWHDDHIGGLSEVLTACKSAQFGCSAALTRTEFIKTALLFSNDLTMKGTSGTSEFSKVFYILKRRRQKPIRALADRPIFTLLDNRAALRCKITALSPSDGEFDRFLASMARMMPRRRTSKFRLPNPQPNDLSVALWVQIHATNILLGADLEEHGSIGRGWTAVLSSANRPLGRAALFKIAHHGSETGHHDGIWTTLLDHEPRAVLTPWCLGSKLPTKRDCTRILVKTPHAYATARTTSLRSKRWNSVTARTLAEANIKIADAEPRTGFVHFRRSMKFTVPDWSVALSPEAVRLKDFGN